MAQVALNMRNKTIPERIGMARDIIKKMTGNSSFPSPVPTLTDCGKDTDNLDNAYQAALDGGKTAKAKQRDAEKKFNNTMSMLASYVQTASLGDNLVILSSGMGVKKAASPEEKLPAPENLRCLHSDMPNEALLKWKPVKRSKSYLIEFTDKEPDTETDWKFCGNSTKASYTAAPLTSLTQYWFRVAAIGPLGQSPWSDLAKRVQG